MGYNDVLVVYPLDAYRSLCCQFVSVCFVNCPRVAQGINKTLGFFERTTTLTNQHVGCLYLEKLKSFYMITIDYLDDL